MAKKPTNKKAGRDDIESLTFEEAFEQLQQIVEQIEQGEVGLEESIGRYERGMKLIAHCRKVLQQAERKVLELQQAAEAQPTLEPFEPPEPSETEQEDQDD